MLLLYPIRHKNVELPRPIHDPTTDPEEFFPVRAEVREGVEGARGRDPLQARPIEVDAEEVQYAPFARVVMMIGGEDEALAIRGEDGRESRPGQMSDLTFVLPVRIFQISISPLRSEVKTIHFPLGLAVASASHPGAGTSGWGSVPSSLQVNKS